MESVPISCECAQQHAKVGKSRACILAAVADMEQLSYTNTEILALARTHKDSIKQVRNYNRVNCAKRKGRRQLR